ncbi:UPF0182 family membrane protein [Nocardioides sp. GXQ0305]|uniref:UPF0182 family membrane protein n=1 Tax=Nocardioides sp. GXQ0305 TaxID=3423912 RepID=UPI003D7C761D
MSDLFDGGNGRGGGRPQPRPTSDVAPPRRSRALLITAAVLIVGFFVLTTFAAIWTDRQWFESVDYPEVFTTMFWTRVGLFVAFAALMAAFVGVNMALAYRFRPMFRMPSPEQSGLERYRAAITPIRIWLLVGVSILLGLFAGTSASGQWRSFMLWRNGGTYGDRDPYFERDIGFYLFDLGWYHYLVDSLMAFAVVALLMAALVHYLYGGIQLQTQHDRLTGAAQIQLSVLLGLFVLAKAVDYWLDRFDLVTDTGGLITGMKYTGEHAVLPGKSILMGIALICAVLFFLNVWRRTWMLPSVGLALLVLSAVLIGMIWPTIVQQFQVNPSEADREAPYIEDNIEATRAAYDLKDIEVEPFSSNLAAGNGNLNELEQQTESVPLVDPKVVNQTFEQVQQVRAYYSVADVLDVDRYEMDDTDRALVLGVRELDQSGIAESDRNWNNLHTVYTHGNGMIAAYANQRSEDGTAETGDLVWAEGQQANQNALSELYPDGYESRVYFGELSPSYSVVGKASEGSSDVELDLGNAASADEGQTTTYDGEGGVPVGNLFSELMYAVRFGEPNFLLSGRVHENSKVLYHRTPIERVERVAPWLTVDRDPYPAVVDGRIVWILDGYTTTDRFPQAQAESLETMTDDALSQDNPFGTLPTDEINYMRNAVKATVDAYHGTVDLYAWDENDPMLEAWRNAFPGTVKDKEEMSDELLEHVRYPEDLFKVQRYQFARYHVTDAGDFYQGNDRWEVPEDPYAEDTYQPPYRLFVDDPTISSDETWSLTSNFTPRNKNNLAAFMSVNSDATSEEYGRMRALQLSNEQTDGPGLIANEMANSDNVRRELQAFNLGEIEPTFGNLLTLPVDDGLMYVQPVYATRELSEASYPILQFVIVSYGDQVGIGDSLVEALADVLGVDPESVTEPIPSEGGGDGNNQPPPNQSTEEQIALLLRQAQAAFDAADAAYRDGDPVEAAEQQQKARRLIDEAVTLYNEAGGGSGGDTASQGGDAASQGGGG